MELNKTKKYWLHLIAFITSFNSFSIFAIICKYLGDITGKEILTQLTVTTVFLCLLGCVSIYIEQSHKDKVKRFIKAEYLLALYFLILPILLSVFEVIYHTPSISNWIWIPFMFLVVVPLGLLTGVELPSFLSIFPKKENIFLFINYSGSLFSSFFIIQLYDSTNDYLYLCLTLAGINFFIYYFSKIILLNKNFKNQLIPFTLFAICFVVMGYFPGQQKVLKKMSYLNYEINSFTDWSNLELAAKSGKDITTVRSPYQTIDMVSAELHKPFSKDDRWGLYLNHKIQFFSDTEKIYHQTMAFYPMIYLDKIPSNVLVLGGGDLGLARELSRITEKTINITVIELDQKILELAKTNPNFKRINHYQQIKDKIKIINGDAISFLRRNSKKYDMIIADFPFPTSFELGKLYSREFYQLIYKSLSKDGFFILDFPFRKNATLSDSKAAAILINTLKSAGFYKSAVFGVTETFLINMKSDVAPLYNFNKLNKYIDNFVLTNLVDQTESFSEIFKQKTKIHSIFKPAMEFKIDG